MRYRNWTVLVVVGCAAVFAVGHAAADEEFTFGVNSSFGQLFGGGDIVYEFGTGLFSHGDGQVYLNGQSDQFTVRVDKPSQWKKTRFRVAADFGQYGTLTYVVDAFGRVMFVVDSTIADCATLQSSDLHRAIVERYTANPTSRDAVLGSLYLATFLEQTCSGSFDP